MYYLIEKSILFYCQIKKSRKRRKLSNTSVYFCQIEFDHLIKVRDNNNSDEEKV